MVSKLLYGENGAFLNRRPKIMSWRVSLLVYVD